MAKVSGYSFAVEATPTLDTNAYAAGDHMGTLMTVDPSFSGIKDGDAYVLQSITIVDKAKQDAAINVFFFDESPTLTSSDNAALDISDAEMADKCVGFVSIAAGDYADLNVNSVATVRNLGLNVKPIDADASGPFYAILQSQGAPTYAASDLVVKFHFAADIK